MCFSFYFVTICFIIYGEVLTLATEIVYGINEIT